MTDKEFYLYLRSMPEQIFDIWIANATNEELDRAERVYLMKWKKDDEPKITEESDDVSTASEYLKKFRLGK